MKRFLCAWLPNWPKQRLSMAGAERFEREGRETADRAALAVAAGALGRFSPLVGLENAPRPESIFLDVTAVAGLFGGEQALAQSVWETLAARRLTARVAVADTIGAAWALAHYAAQAESGPLVSVAERPKKPGFSEKPDFWRE